MAGKDEYVKSTPGLMSMNVPIWDGSPETLEHYEEEVELLMLGTTIENRKFLGPRLMPYPSSACKEKQRQGCRGSWMMNLALPRKWT